MQTRRLPLLTPMLTGAALALALSACAKKAPQQLPPPPADTPQTTGQVTPTTPTGPTPGSQAAFVAEVASDRVLFETDSSTLDDSDREILRSQATWLARWGNKRVTVEGHADERGTRDYNLALGERRANAAKNYLASLGVDPSRITVISYGKERPAALGSDEASWAQNRRAVTVTVE